MLKLTSLTIWALVALVFLVIMSFPVSIEAHLLESTTIIAILIAIKLVDRKRQARILFLSLGTTAIIQYVLWRVTNTLPSIYDLQNFIPDNADTLLCPRAGD